MGRLYDELIKDYRVKEGLKTCINCGTCTAICPAAEFYRYDPRKIVDIVQSKDEAEIEKLLKKPEINWKQLLRKFVGTIPVPHRSTRTRLNRRMPERSDLSGKLPKRHVEIVVAIDTSGSMSDSDISYVLNEIFNIVKDYLMT